MKFINVRQLLSDINKSTENLPVTVTRYGKPIFILTSVNSQKVSGENSIKISTGHASIPTVIVEPMEFHQCSNPTFKCDTPGTIKKGNKWFCSMHAVK